MKISVLRKLRSSCLRKRELNQRAYDNEIYDPLNLYRPRIAGRIEAYDAIIDRIDAHLKSHHDKRHDRRKKS